MLRLFTFSGRRWGWNGVVHGFSSNSSQSRGPTGPEGEFRVHARHVPDRVVGKDTAVAFAEIEGQQVGGTEVPYHDI